MLPLRGITEFLFEFLQIFCPSGTKRLHRDSIYFQCYSLLQFLRHHRHKFLPNLLPPTTSLTIISMDLIINGLQHIGIPVTDIATSEAFYKRLGFANVMKAPFTIDG